MIDEFDRISISIEDAKILSFIGALTVSMESAWWQIDHRTLSEQEREDIARFLIDGARAVSLLSDSLSDETMRVIAQMAATVVARLRGRFERDVARTLN